MAEQSGYQPFPTKALDPGSAGSSPSINVNASPDAFGAPIARGLQQLGQAGMEFAERKQALTNELYANDISVQGMRGATRVWDWYGKLEGRAASDARDRFQSELEENYKKTIEAAPNDSSKSMLLRSMRSITERYLQYGESYAETQFKKWNHESHTNRALELGNQAAASRYHDQKYMENLVEAGVQQAVIPKRDAGMAGEELTALEKETRGKLYTPIIEMMASEGQVRRASELFATHREKFDNATQLKIESFLKPKVEALSAENIGKRALHDITSQLETGAKSPLAGVGSITTDDTHGAHAYGNWGLQGNARQGNLSVDQFVREFDPDGSRFGLTAKSGTREFDQQWRAAARNNPEALHRAEIAWHDQNVMPKIAGDLGKAGVPEQITKDPRVQAYFADRNVQQGEGAIDKHSSRVSSAWKMANDDPVQFLRNMSHLDRGHVEGDFRSYLGEHPGRRGALLTRVNQREKLSLGVSSSEPGASVTELAVKAGLAPTKANAFALGLAGQEEGQPVSARDRHEFYSGGKGEALQRAVEIAEREHPDNPRIRQMAMNQVREHFNILSADAADEARAEHAAEKQRKALQEAAESKYLQDFYSDNPQTTARDIVADPHLDAAAKEKMITARARALKDDPEETLSRKSARNMPDIMKRITDDAALDRVKSKNDIREEFYAGNIKFSDMQHLEKVFDEVRSPDGGPIVKAKERFLEHAEKAVKAPFMGLKDDQAEMNAYAYRMYVESQVETAKRKGDSQAVLDLFTPGAKTYLGKPETLQLFQRSQTEIIGDMSRRLGGAKTEPSEIEKMRAIVFGGGK